MNKYIHFNISVFVNDDRSYWNSPRGEKQVQVDIPVELFEEKRFASYLKALAEATEKEFDIALALDKEQKEVKGE